MRTKSMLMLIWTSLLVVLGGCGYWNDKGERKFRYDATKDECRKGSRVGWNVGVIGECGAVSDTDLSDQDLSGRNLRGMAFVKSNLNGANFSKSDLLGAVIVASNLDNTDFRDANLTAYIEDSTMSDAKLQGTQMVSVVDGAFFVAEVLRTELSGALIDSRSVLDMSLREALERGLIYDGSDNVSANIGRVADVDLSIKTAVSDVQGVNGAVPLSPEEYKRLLDDLSRMADLKFKPGNKWYEMLFGSFTGAALLDFLDERINFVIAKTDERHDANNVSTAASNFANNYWVTVYNRMVDESKRRELPEVVVDGESISFSSTGAGLIALGPAYVNLATDQIERLGTLIHEARHTDCPEDPSNEDLKRIYERNEAPKRSRCNYTHAICTKGSLEGVAACDSFAWGAYGVEAVFFEKIARDCENCSEVERQFALVAEKNAKSRITVLDDMLAGKLGNPETTSRTQ